MRFNLAAAAGFAAAVVLPAPQLPPEQAQPAELLQRGGSGFFFFLLSACGWAAGWGTDKAANWLCRQMIAGNAANQGEATFKSIERLRCTPSRAGGAPKGPNSG